MIKIEEIKKVFNPHSRNANQVLKGVSFELPETGLVAIFGKSGSGKTTLLNIIGGLDKQDSGHIYIDGEDTSKKRDYIRNAKIGYIFQNYYLEGGYTIAEIMHNAMIIAGFKDEALIKERTDEVLRLVKMDRYKNKKSDALSGGQKQRVAIARALIKGSNIILADEPTGNLDAENTIIIMDILKEISKTQLVVLVTHEVTLIHEYADSHIKIVDGELNDNQELEKNIKYELDKNNIYVKEAEAKSYRVGETNIKLYGAGAKTDDIEIYTDNGTLYLKPGKGVTILDDNSEKKVIFDSACEEPDEDNNAILPKFEKSGSKRNGRLFTIRSIWKSVFSADEKGNRLGNTFKNIFVVAMAIIMCFFSLTAFEVASTKLENKAINENSSYVNLNAYDDLKIMPKDMYERVDFFDTQMKEGSFTFGSMSMLSGIKNDYVPRAIEVEHNASSFNIICGRMPGKNEVLITTRIASELKNKFRLKELSSNDAMLLVKLNNEFNISGIVDDENPFVYMNKEDYVNFLGIYDDVMFLDPGNIFFEDEYKDLSFSTEILAGDEERALEPNEIHIEINRNSLYKMMKNVVEADYKVKLANAKLIASEGRTGLEIKNSYVYAKKLEITRDVMTTDLRIYVSPEAMDNIFVYIKPNIDALKGSKGSMGIESKFYFEISTKGGSQLESLNNWLSNEKRIQLVNINNIYARENAEIQAKANTRLNIFIVAMVLLFFIYYFIEKSGSLRNSKEYGIYRAIGVNKGNLLYKELIRALIKNIFIYLLGFLLIITLMSIRYYMMNIAFSLFIAIAAVVFILSTMLMLLISLIPYLFVLFKTPSEIIARYDI